MSGQSNVARHWRGDCSLAWSYWGNGLIALALTLCFRLAILLTERAADDSPALIITVIAFAALLSGAVAVWQITGTWRSSKRHYVVTGARLWPHVAQATLIVAAVVAIGNVWRLGEDLYGYEKAAYGSYRLTERGTTELVLTGDVARAVPAAVQARLAANRAISVFVFDSAGGLEAAAWELRAVIAARGLVTRTETRCSQVCFMPFMAGTERVVDPAAKLGYYQSPTLANRAAEDQYLRSRGVTEDFISEAQSVPPNAVWFPRLEELVAGHVVTGIHVGDRVEPAEQYCRSSGQCS